MKPDEAASLTDMLRAYFPNLTDDQANVYQDALLFENGEHASKAILAGIREWKHPPRWAEIVERIRMERRKAEPDREPEPVSLAVYAIPLWVRRWIASRYLYASFGLAKDMRRFMEQGKYADAADDLMPDGEWVAEAAHVTDERVWKTLAG